MARSGLFMAEVSELYHQGYSFPLEEPGERVSYRLDMSDQQAYNFRAGLAYGQSRIDV